MKAWKTKCGLHCDPSEGGETCYMGESWGEEFGKNLQYCPYPSCENCAHHKEFKAKYPDFIWADCESFPSSEEYNYELSAEKISDNLRAESREKIEKKFNGGCLAISPDGKGGFKIDRDDNICKDCDFSFCAVTNQPRDTTKVRLMADIENIICDKIGFYENVKKRIIRRRIYKGLLPLEVAERIIATPQKSTIITLADIRNLNVLRIYYEKPHAKRDTEKDAKYIAAGYEIVNEADYEKAAKIAKSAKLKVAREKKVARRLKQAAHKQIPVQVNLFEVKYEN